VWGRADNDVFFVGEAGVILHWDGAAFTREKSGIESLLFTVHGGPNGPVLAVGGTTDGVILRWSDSGWLREATPENIPPLSGIFVRPDGTAVAVGDRGTVLMRDSAGQWIRRRDEVLRGASSATLHAASYQRSLWAVGGDFSTGQDGIILSEGTPVQGAILQRPHDADAGTRLGLDAGFSTDAEVTDFDAGVVDASIYLDTAIESDFGHSESSDARPIVDAFIGIDVAHSPDGAEHGEGCGDRILSNEEECDDGNRLDGDGCSAACRRECGNGVRDLNETCDDGNRIPDDGCDAECQLECGNGRPNRDEECDDGNRINGDGCSAACAFERLGAGEACEFTPCAVEFECLGVAMDDFFPVCTIRCETEDDCLDAGFTEAVVCDLIGPQLIDTYCVPERCYDGDCDENDDD